MPPAKASQTDAAQESATEGSLRQRFVGALAPVLYLLLLYFLLAWLAVLLGAVQILGWLLRGRHDDAIRDFCLRFLGYLVHVASYSSLLTQKVPFPFGPLRSLDLERIRGLVEALEGETLQESMGKATAPPAPPAAEPPPAKAAPAARSPQAEAPSVAEAPQAEAAPAAESPKAKPRPAARAAESPKAKPRPAARAAEPPQSEAQPVPPTAAAPPTKAPPEKPA